MRQCRHASDQVLVLGDPRRRSDREFNEQLPAQKSLHCMKPLSDFVSDANVLLTLEGTELAGIVLEQLCSAERNMLHLYSFTETSPRNPPNKFPQHPLEEISDRLAEAWAWLIAHGLIAPRRH